MSEWIKCSDREHPDLIMDESGEFAESEHVLVTIWEGPMSVAYFCELYDENGPWKRTWVDVVSGMDFDIKCNVTHWQPLPQSPNE